MITFIFLILQNSQKSTVWTDTCVCLSMVKLMCALRTCRRVNKRLLDGGFGAKSWLGILINHWPSSLILTSLYSFICCCCSLKCPPACSAPVYVYPVDIPPLLSPPLFECPSALFLISSVVYCTPCDSPPVGPVFSSPGQDKSLPKTLFSYSGCLIDSAGAK